MKLKALSMADMLQVAEWRNQQLPMLRTPFPLTEEMQADFYSKIISNRQANARYWGIWDQTDLDNPDPQITNPYYRQLYHFIGMAGIESIQWENRLAEISLLLNPKYSTDEFLSKALALVLRKGFMNLNLENIFTEVYWCNPNNEFWMCVAKKYKCRTASLPERKYYNGSYYGSVYINFNKEDYLKHENTISKSTQASD